MTRGITLTRQDAHSGDGVEARFRVEGLSPHPWSNGPGESYGWHSHAYHKILYRVKGTIT